MNSPERMPVAGQDYPRTWSEFMAWFASAEACQSYLERLRWPQGFVCSNCGAIAEPYRASGGRLMCRHCRHQASVTAGTVFDKTRTPLRTWLAAAWYLTNQKQGVSALGLQRVLESKRNSASCWNYRDGRCAKGCSKYAWRRSSGLPCFTLKSAPAVADYLQWKQWSLTLRI